MSARIVRVVVDVDVSKSPRSWRMRTEMTKGEEQDDDFFVAQWTAAEALTLLAAQHSADGVETAIDAIRDGALQQRLTRRQAREE